MEQAVEYEEDLHLIPTVELDIKHFEDHDEVYIHHQPTKVLVKESYLKGEDPLLAVQRGISNLTYQVYLHRLQEQKATQQDSATSDILNDLIKRVEKLEHAARMR